MKEEAALFLIKERVNYLGAVVVRQGWGLSSANSVEIAAFFSGRLTEASLRSLLGI